jgi:hypothetical protein
MIHKISTTSTVKDEYVLTCTCGVPFIGSPEGIQRDMTYHQIEASRV